MPQTMEYDANRFRLGSLCKRGHAWPGTSQSLRRNKYKGVCIECEKIHIAKRENTPEKKEALRSYQRNYIARHRSVNGRESRSKYIAEEKELRFLQGALCRALRPGRRYPTVARLVMREQLRYWKANPGEKRRHDTEWARVSWWLQYQISPDLRLYHREKSKRRKAQDRGQTPLQVPVKALRQRFNEFGHRCAYCGQEGDMQIEHVEPISEGGLHDIGNIVPACWPCNASKRTSEMESWYRQQPFFSELRLQAIRRVTRQPEGAQLALALA